MLLTAELLILLPVGWFVTNVQGIAVGRTSESEWECAVEGMKTRTAVTADGAAELIEQMRSL